MQGRYGVDQFSRFTIGAAFVAIVLTMFTGTRTGIGVFLDTLGMLVLVYTYFRIFSKNIQKRYEENQKYLQMGQTAEQYLEYAFDFLEGTGLTGQEMVIFITELNSNARSVAFLQECESERYFRYNKELLFSEKREKILEKLN